MALVPELFALALMIFTLVCEWKIFEKAGEHGWASLIPFYDGYVTSKIAQKKWTFWASLGISIAAVISLITMYMSIFTMILTGRGQPAVWIIGLTIITFGLYIAAAVIGFIRAFALAKVFGKGAGTGVLVALIPFVGLAILAFSDDAIYNPYDNPTRRPYREEEYHATVDDNGYVHQGETYQDYTNQKNSV